MLAKWLFVLLSGASLAAVEYRAQTGPFPFPELEGKKFDVIIVGAGTAGSILANRLTEDPNLSVLVIEGGRDDARLKQLLPLPAPYPIPNPKTNFWSSFIRPMGALSFTDLLRSGFVGWQFTPLYRDDPDSRFVGYSRAATWGGCSAHNAAVCQRASPQYFDDWAKLGCPEWSFEKVLPYYKKMENRSQRVSRETPYYDPALPPGALRAFDPKFMGDKGPLPLAVGIKDDALSTAFKASAQLLKFPINIDFDYPSNNLVGVSSFSRSVLDTTGPDFAALNPYKDGVFAYPEGVGAPFAGKKPRYQRCHSGSEYLYPILDRPNLTIISEAFVTKILFNEQKEAVGVEFISGWNVYGTGRNVNTEAAGLGGTPQDAQYAAKEALKHPHTLRANREVILCGGAFNSPQLLLLSGVGPEADLKELDIPVVANLPGVGRHLKDQGEFYLTWKTKEPLKKLVAGADKLPVQVAVLKFGVKNSPEAPTSFFTLAGSSVEGATPYYETLDKGLRNRRLPMHTYIPPRDEMYEPALDYATHVGGLLIMQSNIKSEGFLKLVSKNPTEPPHIVLNYNKDPEDLKTWINAFKEIVVPYVENLAKEEARFTEVKEGDGAKIVKGGEGYFDKWIHPAESDFRTEGQFDEAKLSKFLQRYVDGHHASSTCKMGASSDPQAVVDQYGHVYGVKKLRVCDASIFPEVPDMYIVGSVFMIGERMADLIKMQYSQLD